MPDLPPEIITDLLSRLPVKSPLRFRCVSKPWCAEIDGPDFIKLHLNRSIASISNLSSIAQSGGTLYSLDLDSLEKVVKIGTPFTKSNEIILDNSCNGLLLLRTKDVNWTLFLFNPSTRKHCALPSPPAHKKPADVVFIRSYCLGYDAMNDDYKVFSILDIVDEENNLITSEANVYSLTSNSWRTITNFANGITYKRAWDAYVNGALHTFNHEKPRKIVAFDIGVEAFSLMPLPEFWDRNATAITYRVHVFGGCLCVLCRYPDFRTDIWVMEEYGVKESWTMLVSVLWPNPYLYVIPIVYSKTHTEVLLSYDRHKLVWYDLRKKTARDFQVCGLPSRFGPLVCVGSLVSVGSLGKIDENKKQQ